MESGSNEQQTGSLSSSKEPVVVTVDNFIRAESDRALAGIVQQGGFARFEHFRELTPIDKQVVPRGNRDTLYSVGVFDLDAGPVTVTLPDAGVRFMTMMAIDQDHNVYSVVYGKGIYSYARERVGTRYVLLAVRILIDPTNPQDVEQVHALQDAIKISRRSVGCFEVPRWDEASRKSVREALLVLNSSLPDLRRAFGAPGHVDPVRHLIATAAAWGGNPDRDAVYLNVTPAKNDGVTVYRLIVRDVPVDGFWSVSVYDAKGYFQKNSLDRYALNDLTAKRRPDGSVAIQFGGCEANAPNCLPITPGWNYMVRLYRPRPEILNGKWRFPEAEPLA